MAGKKPLTTKKKKSLMTARTSKPGPSKKKTVETVSKTITASRSASAAKAKKKVKASVKMPVTVARGKKLKKKSVGRPAAAKKPPVQKTATKSKKKLSPRESKIQHIKKTLLMQRNALLSEAEEALNALPGQTIFPDMGDQASAEIDRSFMLRLRGREQRLLKKIEQAIEKIDSGVYGICDVCGEEITVQRLEARPVTTMCIFCKTEQEEEEKLRGK